ncbi:hypothetical protein NQZ68_036259 [Dissostichus eleginoides]|nr:hypothetical protein NQZ68_036259 [Dissostichus eleginoides]
MPALPAFSPNGPLHHRMRSFTPSLASTITAPPVAPEEKSEVDEELIPLKVLEGDCGSPKLSFQDGKRTLRTAKTLTSFKEALKTHSFLLLKLHAPPRGGSAPRPRGQPLSLLPTRLPVSPSCLLLTLSDPATIPDPAPETGQLEFKVNVPFSGSVCGPPCGP